MRHSEKNNSAGFTLIETIIVVVIGVVLGVFLLGGLNQQGAQQDLDFAVTSLVSFVRDAQERSRGQESSNSWGVHFENQAGDRDFFSLFIGSVYLGSASSTIFLPISVEFSDPGSGSTKDVIFQKVTGEPTASAAVTLRLVDNTAITETITLNDNGSISY